MLYKFKIWNNVKKYYKRILEWRNKILKKFPINFLIYLSIGLVIIAFVLPFIILYLKNISIINLITPESKITEIGPIGDYFTGISTPIITLAIFISTIVMLWLTKTEFQETSNALNEQKEMSKKAFNSEIFFRLLDRSNDFKYKIKVQRMEKQFAIAETYKAIKSDKSRIEQFVSVKESFKDFCDMISSMSKNIKIADEKFWGEVEDGNKDIADEILMKLVNEFNQYFYSMEVVLEFIDKYVNTKEEKDFYIKVWKQEIDECENDFLNMIIITGILDDKYPNLLNLLRKYFTKND